MSASASSPDNGESSTSSALTKRRKNITLACLACKSRKSKCSGTQPCDACVRRNGECIFDQTSDHRRREPLKRKIDEIEEERDILKRILGNLRDSPHRRAMQLLHLIRSNASVGDLSRQLEAPQRSLAIENANAGIEGMSDARLYLPQGKAEGTAMDIGQLLDERNPVVAASPWTTVTNDDMIVSHLLALWFTWCHPWLNYIDHDMFIRDMKSGNPDSEYCSPFLVNAILADACSYSNFPEAYADPTDSTTRGAHFYEEAKRHLEMEGGRVKLPTIQGLLALSVCAILIGKDRRDWTYVSQLACSIKDFTTFFPPAANPTNEAAATFERVASHTLWGLYNVTTGLTMAFQKIPMMTEPNRPVPLSSHSIRSDKWYPYPDISDGVEGHTRCIFISRCELARMNADMCWLLFDDEQKLSPAELEQAAMNIYARLEEWQSNLPECLALTQDRPLPQLLSLRVYYHTLVIRLFRFLEKAQETGDAESSTDTDVPDTVVTAAREVARLLELQRVKWGMDIFQGSYTQGLGVSLFALLDHIDEPKSREAFINLCVAARAASRRWHLGKAMLRALQLTATQMGLQLPSEVRALFSSSAAKIWSSKDMTELSSFYPIFATYAGSDQDSDLELDRFLKQWDQLSLSESPQSS